jgi:hypothetical protein
VKQTPGIAEGGGGDPVHIQGTLGQTRRQKSVPFLPEHRRSGFVFKTRSYLFSGPWEPFKPLEQKRKKRGRRGGTATTPSPLLATYSLRPLGYYSHRPTGRCGRLLLAIDSCLIHPSEAGSIWLVPSSGGRLVPLPGKKGLGRRMGRPGRLTCRPAKAQTPGERPLCRARELVVSSRRASGCGQTAPQRLGRSRVEN